MNMAMNINKYQLCGRRKESAAVYVMTQQHRRKLTQQRRQNNNISEVITHKSIQYNKWICL